jgi:hypothetical protein
VKPSETKEQFGRCRREGHIPSEKKLDGIARALNVDAKALKNQKFRVVYGEEPSHSILDKALKNVIKTPGMNRERLETALLRLPDWMDKMENTVNRIAEHVKLPPEDEAPAGNSPNKAEAEPTEYGFRIGVGVWVAAIVLGLLALFALLAIGINLLPR